MVMHGAAYSTHTPQTLGSEGWRDGSTLGAWRHLMEGGWTVIDRARDESAHAIVLRRAPGGPETLTKEELCILVSRARGDALKQIADDLGRTIPSVSSRFIRAKQKLGLRSHAEMVTLFGPGLVLRESRDETRLLLTYPAPRWPLPTCLSSAERRVALLLIDGASQAQIATALGRARRTVANHVSAVYRKTQVNSRVEFFVELQRLRP
jgi:DNA-binding CsgD family transcriptional regulator